MVVRSARWFVHFELFMSATVPSPIGPAPLLQDQHFSELLGSQGFSTSRNRPPQTLKDLKGKQDIENALDPEAAKVSSSTAVAVPVCVYWCDCVQVREWSEGKKRNIRALLCDLHSILWDGEERWKAVQMKDLITADQVKKSFRKACLSVHPDKVTLHNSVCVCPTE